MGIMQSKVECPHCGPCKECGGTGRVKVQWPNVPPFGYFFLKCVRCSDAR